MESIAGGSSRRHQKQRERPEAEWLRLDVRT
jgi:hypothetical protein